MTVDEIKRKYPNLSEEEAHQVERLLQRPRASVRRTWEAEAQLTETMQSVGPSGLTVPMRVLNEFAENNALPLPFPLTS